MLLRSERRERRLRRSRPIAKSVSSCGVTKKPSSSPSSVSHKTTNSTNKNVGVNSKCNTTKSSSITPRITTTVSLRVSKRKSTSRTIKIGNKKTQKISDELKENCWLVEQTEVTLFDESDKASKLQKEGNSSNAGAHDSNNTVEDIGSPCDSRNQFGPIVLNATGSSSSSSVPPLIISSSCCSCDAEGLSSSKHTKKPSTTNSSNVIIKCISECDSTTGFDSDDEQNSLQIDVNHSMVGIEGDDNNASDKSIFDGIVPEVDSTTDLLVQEIDDDEKKIQLPKLILPSTFNHTFPTPDITPSSRQFPCYNTLTNNYSTSSEALISFFDEVINKNAANDLVNQYSDYTAYTSYFSHGLNLSDNDLTAATITAATSSTSTSLLNSQNLLNLDQQHNTTDLSFLSMHQTAIDNLKALSNFQAQNFLNLSSTSSSPLSIRSSSVDGDVEMDVDVAAITAHDSFIQSVQQTQLSVEIDRPSCMYNNNNEDLSSSSNAHDDIRLETDECMEIEEVDSRQISTAYIFDPYLFIKNLPPLTADMRAKCPALPLKTRSSPEFTLVLDLDETLVHCSLQELSDASFKFPVLFQDCKYTVFVRTRPFFREFLEKVSKMFEVILFTASKRVYADKLLNLLDPDRKWIKYRLFREHCILVNGNYIKDLTILGRDLSKTIIIDNSPQAFGYQLENGIPIESWFMDQNDTELIKLVPFLEELAKLKQDVRPHIRERFRLFSYLPPD